MSSSRTACYESRVLVLAPTSGDAAMTAALLAEARLDCAICNDLTELCARLEEGAGAILLTEEVLHADPSCLIEILKKQPPWSDMPILLLADSGADSPAAIWAMELLGNVMLLERPIRVTTLISALRTALMARQRQYQVRANMETLRRQNERLRLLWEAASALFSANDPDSMLKAVFQEIAVHLGVDAYFNFVVSEAGDSLRLASYAGIPDEAARSIGRLEFGQAVCGRVALQRHAIVAAHIQSSSDQMVQLVKSLGIRVYACNPLLFGTRLLGTLSFASRVRDEFKEDELEFLETISRYVTVAYERLRLIEQLRETDRRKDEFLAQLAHELRNPLAPVRNAVQVLRLRGSDEPELRWGREVIERQVVHLTRLIDDLLDISRITRNKLELRKQRLELAEVVHGALETSRPLIDQQGHQLTVSLPSEPVYLLGDLIRLAQVFMNLLNNAAKYTDPGGHIWLTAERVGGEIVVRVKDTGVGIPPEKLPKLFEMFFQVDHSLERAQGGLGIGLSLVRRLVELHGGTVDARSEGTGKGTEFTVRLPTVTPDEKARAPQETRETHQQKPVVRRRVLVVDDNQDSADSLAMLLRLMGNEVHTAHDGIEAVEMTEKVRPDVVLLDIGMPRLNGYDACRCIRDQPWGRNVVLIALTGWGKEEDRRRTEEAGFNGHMVKPVELSALMDMLSTISP